MPIYAEGMAKWAIPEWVAQYTEPPPGSFLEDDLRLFALINEIQVDANVAGDLLEVGACRGKSAVALGFMCQASESLTVIDPWESDEEQFEENTRERDRYYPGLTLAEFKANYRRFHDQLPDIRQGLSGEQLKDLPAERFRFIHIDGSHEWRAVAGDVEQVLRVLSPNGVVAFDDLFIRNLPGVGAAVWPACASGDLVPVATTNKLYATHGPSRSVNSVSVARAIEDDTELFIQGRHPIFGWEVLEVRMR
jgi:hypothetical protein